MKTSPGTSCNAETGCCLLEAEGCRVAAATVHVVSASAGRESRRGKRTRALGRAAGSAWVVAAERWVISEGLRWSGVRAGAGIRGPEAGWGRRVCGTRQRARGEMGGTWDRAELESSFVVKDSKCDRCSMSKIQTTERRERETESPCLPFPAISLFSPGMTTV